MPGMTDREDNDPPRQLLRRALLEGDSYSVEAARAAPGHSKLIQLDAMENPHLLPAALAEELGHLLAQVPLNRYPDPQASALKEALAQRLPLPPGRDLLLGNGSDELIQLLFLAINRTHARSLGPGPSFVMYRRLAPLLGLRHVEIPLRAEDFSLDEVAMLQGLRQHAPALLWLARPNNPTGTHYPMESLRRLIEAAPGLVVIDEAYQAFSEDDCLELLQEYDKLLLLRTFSKQGLAGLRLGLLLGPHTLLRELEKLRLPYNIGSLNQAAACFLLRHWQIVENQVRKICGERARLEQELQHMEGIRSWPSQANFLLFRCLQRKASHVFQELLKRGLLLKQLHNSHPLLENCLRVSVGTAEENDHFLKALNESLRAPAQKRSEN